MVSSKGWHDTVAVIRRYFVTGLLIVLPSVLTIYIVWILFGFVGGFVAPFLRVILRNVVGTEIIDPLVTLLSVVVTAALICLVGITGTLFSQQIFQKAETIFRRIPLVRSIYGSIRQIIDLVAAKDAAFQKVAVIEFPRKGLYSICFVTSRRRWDLPGRSEPAITVFLPTSPNPTSGFFLLIPESEATILDISVDDAVKMIVSGGMIGPANRHLLTGTGTPATQLSREEVIY